MVGSGSRNFPMDGRLWKDAQGTYYPDLARGAFWGTILFGSLLIILFLILRLWR